MHYYNTELFTTGKPNIFRKKNHFHCDKWGLDTRLYKRYNGDLICKGQKGFPPRKHTWKATNHNTNELMWPKKSVENCVIKRHNQCLHIYSVYQTIWCSQSFISSQVVIMPKARRASYNLAFQLKIVLVVPRWLITKGWPSLIRFAHALGFGAKSEFWVVCTSDFLFCCF